MEKPAFNYSKTDNINKPYLKKLHTNGFIVKYWRINHPHIFKTITLLVFWLMATICQASTIQITNQQCGETKYNLKLTYPHYYNIALPLIKVNHDIDDCIKLMKNTYLRHLKAKTNGFKQKNIRDSSYFNLNYHTIYNTGNILSFTLIIDEVKYPTIHVNCPKIISFNYYLNNQKKLLLPDCFSPDFDYLSFIHNYCYQEILNNFIKANYQFSHTTLKESIYDTNINNFQITHNSLVIYFNPNEIISFSHGIQKIIIPYSKLTLSSKLRKALYCK